MIDALYGFTVKDDDGHVRVSTAGGIIYYLACGKELACGSWLGGSLEIYVHLHRTEQADTFYGFKTPESRAFFRLLLSAKGIGPKTALAILDKAPIEEAAKAVREDRPAYFAKIPGVGQKTAERLVLELARKLKKAK